MSVPFSDADFEKYGVALRDVRRAIASDDGIVVVTDDAALIIEHSPEIAASVSEYLRERGIPVSADFDE